jgi:protease-4
VAEVDRIGQGRVWAGSTAMQLKLVDRMGGLDVAVAAAAKRAGLKGDVRTIDIEREESPLITLLNDFFGPGEEQEQVRDPYARIAGASRLQLLAAIGDMKAIANGPTMQAACMECGGLGSPRTAQARAGGDWLGRLAALTR